MHGPGWVSAFWGALLHADGRDLVRAEDKQFYTQLTSRIKR